MLYSPASCSDCVESLSSSYVWDMYRCHTLQTVDSSVSNVCFNSFSRSPVEREGGREGGRGGEGGREGRREGEKEGGEGGRERGREGGRERGREREGGREGGEEMGGREGR